MISKLIKSDKFRIQALQCVQRLELPQCYIAAGFVRNLVWDYLHGFDSATELNDIDVIYFDSNERDQNKYIEYESALKKNMPNLNWQVRNQAIMHIRNNDKPYKNSLDAMSFWPEKETAVAVRLLKNGELECISAFGTDSLFSLKVTHNPKRARSVFNQRVTSKGWLGQWPKLRIAA
ncbi:nucleotidyltransferase family protein [Endozoicomonas sp. 4G]|uniref:nucleotidyltransferase family protein n=1 Tax=Endozoicomonas sp. 4G TaxID=2872754 RepID=UPI0020787E50|nr:nucleotidyltransferase family protein [Endozoicomonas sp. 4G]